MVLWFCDQNCSLFVPSASSWSVARYAPSYMWTADILCSSCNFFPSHILESWQFGIISIHKGLLVLSDFSKVTDLSVSHLRRYVPPHLFQLHCLAWCWVMKFAKTWFCTCCFGVLSSVTLCLWLGVCPFNSLSNQMGVLTKRKQAERTFQLNGRGLFRNIWLLVEEWKNMKQALLISLCKV